MWVNVKNINRWLRLQWSKPATPYSLCHRQVEALPVFQALRAYAEQQTLDQDLGLERTTRGAAIPDSPVEPFSQHPTV